MTKKKKKVEEVEIKPALEGEEIDETVEDDFLNSGEWEEAKKSPVVEAKEKILAGYHPITKEPVYI